MKFKLGLLLALAALAAWQITRLSDGSNSATPPIHRTNVGDSVTNVVVAELGSTIGVSFKALIGNACSLAYFFDPTCEACSISARSWMKRRELRVGSSSPALYWVAVGSNDPDSVKAFVEKFDLRVPIYRATADRAAAALGVNAVPTVWGVSGGIIRVIERGAYSTSPDSLAKRADWCA